MHKVRHQNLLGFTIVELLVVIVVIGILATITIVSYAGISKQAVSASLKSDLANASRQLKIFQVDNGYFPTSINTCPATAGTMCLKLSSGNEFGDYSRPTAQTFIMDAKNNNVVYRITENSAPGEVAPLISIAAIGGVVQRAQVLTAGALTPSGATASYQWQSSASSGGVYSPIAGATSNTYVPVLGDVGRFIRVVATGSGTYWSSVTSVPTIAVASIPPTVVNGSLIPSGSWSIDAYWDSYMGNPPFFAKDTNEPFSIFNLSSYMNGTINDATLSWSVDSTVPVNNVVRTITTDTPLSTLYVISSGAVIPTSYTGSNLTSYVDSKRGGDCKINWKIDTVAETDVADGRTISNPRLTFTWIPN